MIGYQLLLLLFVRFVTATRMKCGQDVDLCGVIVLESGLGANEYRHKFPTVHGLWPQVEPYGDSKCVLPADMTPPKKVYSCYDDSVDDISPHHQENFENHEWFKHGTCSGVKNVDDYFKQVCTLAKEPLKIMGNSLMKDLKTMAADLRESGYAVYHVDHSHQQIYLSACFSKKLRKWVLSSVDNFEVFCS